ncbi:metallopeptidase family protein [Nonomuraea sp. K271]|uniref:metallopeptidase family protein n=1 Tax=Nonomuraea sp. K271 TaxID=1848319 RepID=UPI00191C6E94|nr:metallopeptidase family protein [Nonomuraea sp. K271]
MASVIEVTREKFEELVAEALDTIPSDLTGTMSNIVVTVVDDPPEPDLLGLYTGIPLTERGDWYSAVLPDRIEIYRNAICQICDTEEDVIEEVRITVVHEIGHHFGMDDARLHELGW